VTVLSRHFSRRIGHRQATDGIEESSGPRLRHADAGGGDRLLDAAQRDVPVLQDDPPPRQLFHHGRGSQRLTAVGQVTQPGGHVDAVPDVVVTLHQDHIARGDARADGDRLHRARDLADDMVQFEDVASSGRVSTHTSMTPSPSHLAMRTPRRAQMSRRSARNAVRISTACSSPSCSVRAVKPETSTKAKLRWTRTERS
jgi:hypothetical protein